MLHPLLVLAVVGAAVTKTVHVPENDNLVVAVPENADRQEPVMRVVAEDLDRVNVVPYMPGAMSRHRAEEGEEEGHMSNRKHSHNPHRRHEEEGRGGEGPDMNMPGMGSQVSPFSPEGSMPGMPTSDQRMERSYTGPSDMSRRACGEALGKVGYCEALLRRAGMCRNQQGGNQRCRDSPSQSCRRSRHNTRRYDHMDRRRFSDYRNRGEGYRSSGRSRSNARSARRHYVPSRRGDKQRNSPMIEG